MSDRSSPSASANDIEKRGSSRTGQDEPGVAIVDAEALKRALQESFTRWAGPPQSGDEPPDPRTFDVPNNAPDGLKAAAAARDTPALRRELLKLKAGLQSSGEWNDLQSLLEKVYFASQLETALELAFSEMPDRLVAAEPGNCFLVRHRHLAGEPSRDQLKVAVAAFITHVVIPDPGRDEVTLNMRTVTGANADRLCAFACQCGLISETEGHQLFESWTQEGVGQTPKERELLEHCLGVYLDSSTAQHFRDISYNYGSESRKVWRTANAVTTVPMSLDVSNYPFDSTTVRLSLRQGTGYDATERALEPDERSPFSLEGFRDTSPPRGFELGGHSDKIHSVLFSPSQDEYMESTLRFWFELRRQPRAVLLRIFVPALITLLLAFSSTALSVFKGEMRESVLTGMLPGLLIACVALQLAGGQHVTQSGSTFMDRMFFSVYANLSLLYLGLQFSVTQGAAGRAGGEGGGSSIGADLVFLGASTTLLIAQVIWVLATWWHHEKRTGKDKEPRSESSCIGRHRT